MLGSSEVLDIGAGSYPIGTLKVDVQRSKRPDVCASVLYLPLRDSSFEKGVCLEMIEHLHMQEQAIALSEIKRVVRGKVVVSIPNSSPFMVLPQQIVWWMREMTTQREYHRNEMTHTHIGLISPKELIRLMQKCGFKVTKAKRLMLYDYMVVAEA